MSKEARIAELRAELRRLAPTDGMSVREIAREAGISPATAQRFRKGMQLDIPTVQALMKAGFITECPCCKKTAGGDP